MTGYQQAMIEGAAATWCWVSDMDASLRFYRDILGLRVTTASPYWSEVVVDGFRIGLHPGLKDRPTGGWTLGLSSVNLAEVKRVAAEFVVEDYHQTPSGVVLTLADPDGNRVQVIQPGSRIEDFPA